MTTLHLLPHAEKLARDNPLGLARWPLYHQMRTLEALREHDLVMNTYNTGTGKTRCAASRSSWWSTPISSTTRSTSAMAHTTGATSSSAS
ncbi:MAG: hypothetical protein IPM84_19105 [Anaerolineae bacterium]|nr:hypothetical protein [Anaerolineae bacterium]